jgi:hypothetical protein
MIVADRADKRDPFTLRALRRSRTADDCGASRPGDTTASSALQCRADGDPDREGNAPDDRRIWQKNAHFLTIRMT